MLHNYDSSVLSSSHEHKKKGQSSRNSKHKTKEGLKLLKETIAKAGYTALWKKLSSWFEEFFVGLHSTTDCLG
ncbi:hypothetical protein MKW98_016910 [Papaver atlanticum]|uniref:Uncharacterized protein n=1 Tax=Papaver atlanticum TaxID=357466 RepID=A0AAD4XVV7_9MAGN|nr:hypothetical protein MKW98_016910 [Papaver atlanticum]